MGFLLIIVNFLIISFTDINHIAQLLHCELDTYQHLTALLTQSAGKVDAYRRHFASVVARVEATEGSSAVEAIVSSEIRDALEENYPDVVNERIAVDSDPIAIPSVEDAAAAANALNEFVMEE